MSKAAPDMTTYYHHYRGEAMSAQQPPATTDRIRMFYTTAVAWDASDEPPIPNFRESSGAEFDRWLAAHDAEREAQVRTQVAADVTDYARAAEVKSERDQLLVALNVVTEKLDRVTAERDQLKTTVDRVGRLRECTTCDRTDLYS